MNFLDLFSGIGGFALGLERAGHRTVAFCEIDPYCQRVLRKHWPDVPVFGDVRELTAKALADACNARPSCTGRKPQHEGQIIKPCHDHPKEIDAICGGFPCQDISVAGKGAGIAGERSGLWSEYARIVGELRPKVVIVENVAALLGRGLDRVLGDLASIRYDAEWHCIPASAVGAPHRRDRVWIVAYSARDVCGEPTARGTVRERTGQCGEPVAVAYASGEHGEGRSFCEKVNENARNKHEGLGPDFACSSMVNAHSARSPHAGEMHSWGKLFAARQRDYSAVGGASWWQSEPDVGRVAHGVPARVDRLRALGNAIVPQIAEIIGRAIGDIDDRIQDPRHCP